MGIHDRDYVRERYREAEAQAARAAPPRRPPHRVAQSSDWQRTGLHVLTWLVAGLVLFALVKGWMDTRARAKSTLPPPLDVSTCQVVSRGPTVGRPDRDVVVLDCPTLRR